MAKEKKNNVYSCNKVYNFTTWSMLSCMEISFCLSWKSSWQFYVSDDVYRDISLSQTTRKGSNFAEEVISFL